LASNKAVDNAIDTLMSVAVELGDPVPAVWQCDPVSSDGADTGRDGTDDKESSSSSNADETWKDVDMSKKGRGQNLKMASIELVAKYEEARPVAKNKVEDVKSLMCYISACHHWFYNSQSLIADKRNIDNDIVDFDNALESDSV